MNALALGSARQDAADAPANCLHCELPIAASMRGAHFCCHGCEAVYGLLHDGELERYYSLRGGTGAPVTDRPSATRDMSWLAEAYEADSTDEQRHLRLDIQGIHCSGCVWVLEKTFKRQPGALKLLTNPALGSVEFWITSEFPVDEWLRSIERFGYRFGPSVKASDKKTDTLLLRVGVSIAIALNVMMLSAALYLGLDSGPLYERFRQLSYALASASVLIGAPVFFRSAIAGLRSRILHLDVPISAGIALAFAGSSWAFWTGRDRALYLDSVSVFIALMLLGRYLQERVLNANRQRLLANEGTEGLRSKRLRSGSAEVLKSSEILVGDALLIAPGDLVPVPVTLLSETALVSTDWITGESRTARHGQDEKLKAGSFNAGDSAFTVRADADFESSPLRALLRPDGKVTRAAHETGLVRAISSYYVVGVLVAAALGFGGWLLATGSVVSSLEVATAVLVVSCPCAFGIATPLAHELVQARLRASGLYVRSGDFFHKLSKVRRLVFDKTGTITTGKLAVDSAVLDDLDSTERHVLYTLASSSNHPVSDAVRRAIFGGELCTDVAVTEYPGRGVACMRAGIEYRLGSARWAAKSEAITGTVFSVGGEVRASFAPHEETRVDARSEIASLGRDGYEVFLLSGDEEARVVRMARDLKIPESNALGGKSPTDKEAWLAEHDGGDMLFIGDGINDSLAAKAASCSGTPALDRPFMASNCDFYLGTDHLAPIREALYSSRQLSRVIRRNLVFALAYNAGAISLAWAGLMQPWLAAILMPASSIAIVLATTISLSPRSATWKS